MNSNGLQEWRRSTLAFMASILILVVGGLSMIAAPAQAEGASGTQNCVNNGRIVPTVSFKTYYGVNVSVKLAGPPSNPSWGATVPANGTNTTSYTTDAWVSPYDEGTWQANSDGSLRQPFAQCSLRSAPAGNAVATANMGDKSCASGNVNVDADGFGDIWISWAPTASSSERRRVKFPAYSSSPFFVKFNRIHTRETAIFDVRVHVYNPDGINPDQWIQGKAFNCT